MKKNGEKKESRLIVLLTIMAILVLAMSIGVYAAAKTCTVTYNANGGTCSAKSKTVTVGGTYGTLPTASWTGHEFLGWYTSTSGTTRVTSGSTVNAQVNHSIYAHWRTYTYKIVFVGNQNTGGSTGALNSCKYDTTYYLPSNGFTRQGYSFAGWNSAADGSGRSFANGAGVSKLTSTDGGTYYLYAQWNPLNCTVSFNPNGGSGAASSKSLRQGSSLNGQFPSAPGAPAGMYFIGWFDAPSGGNQYTNSSSVPYSGTLSLFAHYGVSNCSVTFNVNGGNGQANMPAKSLAQGSSFNGKLYSAPGAPAGMHFTGWYNAASGGTQYTNNSTVPYQGSFTLYAHWEVNKYNIVFAGNGATGGSTTTMVCAYGGSYNLNPNGFVRTGYSFNGWNTASNGSGTAYSNGALISNLLSGNGASLTLYAQWVPSNCTVSFNVNGGNGQASLSNKSLVQGSSFNGKLYSAPGAPLGKHFDGWYNAASGGTKYTDSSVVPYQSKLTLYAHWATNTYNVVFVGNGSTGGSTAGMSALAYGSQYNLTANGFVRSGYDFNGWNTKSDGKGTAYSNGQKVSNLTSTHGATVTLYAMWKQKTCTVTFNANGGGGQSSLGAKSLVQGSTFGSNLYGGPTPPQGNRFVGWFDAAGGGTQYTSSSKVPSKTSLTLYAHYAPINYVIVYEGNGSTNGTMQNTPAAYGQTVTLRKNSYVRTDYNFVEWNTKADGSGKAFKNGAEVSNLTTQDNALVHLYARWAKIEYKVFFDANGGNGGTATGNTSITICRYDKYPKLPSAPTPPVGYTFLGWFTGKTDGSEIKEGMEFNHTSNITLYAHYGLAEYTVRFDANGGYGSDYIADYRLKVNYGKTYGTYGKLPSGIKHPDGYPFRGWETAEGRYIDASATVDKNYNHTLYAHWRTNGIKVSFNANGGYGQEYLNGQSIIVENGCVYGDYGMPGEILDLPAKPSAPSDYTFLGWFDAPSGGNQITKYTKVTATKDHTLYAHWDKTMYTIHFDGNGAFAGSVDDMPCAYGDGVVLPECTFDNGIAFKFWSTTRDDSGTLFDPGTEVKDLAPRSTKTITLYAIWDEDYFNVKYYDGFSGELIENATVKHKVVFRNGIDYDGLVFTGWNTQAGIPLENSVKYEKGREYVIRKDLTLYSVYDYAENHENDFAVIYIDNGGTGGPGAKYYSAGTNVKISTVEPKREGFIFAGWDMNYMALARNAQYHGNDSYDGTVYAGGSVILYALWYNGVITLDYNYEGSSPIFLPVTAGEDIVLPNIKRDGYKFMGWSWDGKTPVYNTDGKESKILSSNSGKTLYAVWQTIDYTVEYYDMFSGDLLLTETLTTEDKITSRTFPVTGLVFTGWTTDSSLYIGNKVKYTSNQVSKITKNMKLYTCYDFAEGHDSEFAVIYLPNGGVGGPGAVYYTTNVKEFTISDKEPVRSGYNFAGWSTDGASPVPKAEYSGGDNFVRTMTGSNYELLYACWDSVVHLYIDLNYNGGSKYDITAIKPGEKLNLKGYIEKRDEYYIKGWGENRTDVLYAKDCDFTMPSRDITLYAIWDKKKFDINYHDGFTGTILFTENVYADALITDRVVEVGGYSFTGWTKQAGFAVDVKPEYKSGDSVFLKDNLDLYACYDTIDNTGKVFRIVYNPNGGTGGPGTIDYDPSRSVWVSRVAPERTGYVFAGWDMSSLTLPQYATYKPDVPKEFTDCKVEAGQQFTLFALWYPNSTNQAKYDLQQRYGRDAMPDDRFDSYYLSSEWEKISDTAYYIIKTYDAADNKLHPLYVSTAMIMEYQNGAWTLTSYGAVEGFSEAWKYEILTNNNNFNGPFLEVLLNAGKKAVGIFCPVAGCVIKAVDLWDHAARLIAHDSRYDTLLEELYKEEVDIKGTIDGKLLEQTIKQLKEKGGLNETALGYISALLKDAANQYKASSKAATAQNDPFGDYDYAISKFKEEIKYQGFSDKLVNDVSVVVSNIYAYVNYADGYVEEEIVIPTIAPTPKPTASPDIVPTPSPIPVIYTTPTLAPGEIYGPTLPPTTVPTQSPVIVTTVPTQSPVIVTTIPTQSPVIVTTVPTQSPVIVTTVPTQSPAIVTTIPTRSPVIVTTVPTQSPVIVTAVPTQSPSVTKIPTVIPVPTPALVEGQGKNGKKVYDLTYVNGNIDAVLTEEESVAVENGAEVVLEAEVNEAKTTKTDKNTAAKAEEEIKKLLTDSGVAGKKQVKNADIEIAGSYRIEINKQVGDSDKEIVKKTQGDALTVSVPITDDLLKFGTKETRVYYMVSKDDKGEVSVNEAKVDKNGKTLTYEALGSGKATLVYTDVPYFESKGTVLKTSNSLNAIYVVTKEGNAAGKTGEVSYVDSQTDKASITIKNTVKVNGIKYNVTEIAEREYENDTTLKKLTIGKNVEKIGANAFAGCKNLKSIIIKSKTLKAANIDKSAFNGISAKATVTVPAGTVTRYKKLFKNLGVNVKVKASK